MGTDPADMVWLALFANLAQDTPQGKLDAARFRRAIKRLDFRRNNVSRVWGRYAADQEHADRIITQVKAMVPPDSVVSLIPIPEKQLQQTKVFWGKRIVPKKTSSPA